MLSRNVNVIRTAGVGGLVEDIAEETFELLRLRLTRGSLSTTTGAKNGIL